MRVMWHSLPRKIVDAPSLFKAMLGRALNNLIWREVVSIHSSVGTT